MIDPLVAVILGVLEEHDGLVYNGLDRAYRCACGRSVDARGAWRAHVAEMVASALEVDRERWLTALRYISQPTMGLPALADPEQFAMDGASERNARLALATCIRIARGALDVPLSVPTEVE